jgi:hypothetical protein
MSKAKQIPEDDLTPEEIADIKAARKSKNWKTYTNYEDLIRDLHAATKLED